MACHATLLDLPLPPHFGILAQRCRGLLRQAHEEAIETRCLSIGRRFTSRNQSLRRRTQRRTETLHMDCRYRKDYPGRQTRATSVTFYPLGRRSSIIRSLEVGEHLTSTASD